MSDVAASATGFDDKVQRERTSLSARPVEWIFAIWLIIAGVVGELAAFVLTLEKFESLADPGRLASCDYSVLVQCTANLNAWQGSAFGFPNPVIGLVGWMAPIVVGAALLAGARFARWFWLLFNLGIAGALAFVVWLISQSIFELGTLCPWCLVTWSVTIPTFVAVTLRNLSAGVFGGGERAERLGATLRTWIVPITIVCFGVIALIAQLELNAFNRLS
jgi:uncharacterized membrane protein